jgi:hypothetical protein
MVAEVRASFAEGHDLGVSRGVAACKILVPASPNDAAVVDDDGSNRDFSDLKRTLRRA